MTIKYKVYDHDIHRYLEDHEVRITPRGAIWYRNGEDWQLYPHDAEFLTIESVEVTS